MGCLFGQGGVEKEDTTVPMRTRGWLGVWVQRVTLYGARFGGGTVNRCGAESCCAFTGRLQLNTSHAAPATGLTWHLPRRPRLLPHGAASRGCGGLQRRRRRRWGRRLRRRRCRSLRCRRLLLRLLLPVRLYCFASCTAAASPTSASGATTSTTSTTSAASSGAGLSAEVCVPPATGLLQQRNNRTKAQQTQRSRQRSASQ